MSLEQAIQEVLRQQFNVKNGIEEIVSFINSQLLYRRKDGQPIVASQVINKINEFPDLFDLRDNGEVILKDKEISVYKNEYKVLFKKLQNTKLLTYEIRILSAVILYISTTGRFNINWNKFTPRDLIISQLDFISNNIKKYGFTERIINLISKISNNDCFAIVQSLENLMTIERPDMSLFGPFFDDVINDYVNTENHNNGQFSSPKVLSKFIGSIFKIPRFGKILDPFAGNGSSLIQAFKYNKHSDPEIIGNDINEMISDLGYLNLLTNECKNFSYFNDDFLNLDIQKHAVDLVVTVPPFGLRTKKPIYEFSSNLIDTLFDLNLLNSNGYLDSQTASLLSSLSYLNENGKAVIVVPDGVLFSGKKDFYLIRKYLINNRLIRGIISLPIGMFRPYIGVSCSILIIDKKFDQNRKLFLFDGSNHSISAFESKAKTIIDEYHNQTITIKDGIFIDYSEIVDENYDLSPKRFLLDEISNSDHSYIKDLTEYVHTGTVIAKIHLNRESGIPFLQVGDLTETSGLNEIDLTKAEYFITSEDAQTRNPRYIPNNAVLIAKVGTKLKPSIYKYKGEAQCNPNIIVIKTDENKLLPEYLITQLQSEYVLRQIDAIRHNVGVPHFSKADFVKIKIKLLTIEDQRSFISSFYGKKLQEAKAITDIQREDDLYNIIASLKHELKQPVSSFGMDLSVLKDFLIEKISSNSLIALTDPTVEILPGQKQEDLKDSLLENVLKRMESAVKDAQTTLSKAEEILNIGSGVFTPEKVAIKEFLINSIKPIFSNANCVINISGEEQELYVDKYQIEVLFKRLIENAIKHGFKKGSDRIKNVINIKLSNKSIYKEFHEIIIENNGIPFPNEFDIFKFQLLGHTVNRYRGTGFGGFHIKRIIESHKGEIYIANNREIGDSQFKVKFKIYLP